METLHLANPNIRQDAYQESSMRSFLIYENYLQMNGHKPLVRYMYKNDSLQMNHFMRKEQEDIDKLEMALHYLKELNHLKKQTLDEYEKTIQKNNGVQDERNNIIIEIYKQHVYKAEGELRSEYDRKTEGIKQI